MEDVKFEPLEMGLDRFDYLLAFEQMESIMILLNCLHFCYFFSLITGSCEFFSGDS